MMTSNANPKPVLLVFGPLALNIDAAAVSKIRDAAASSGHRWLLDDVSNLSADYTTAKSRLPSLRTGQGPPDGLDVGLSQLRQVSLAIKTGQPLVESEYLSFPLPNKVLIPMVLVAQLTQYGEFLARTCTGYATDPREACNRAIQTLGCCTGLLGAFVASCSKNESQFRINAAAAVRLAMLIGSKCPLLLLVICGLITFWHVLFKIASHAFFVFGFFCTILSFNTQHVHLLIAYGYFPVS